MWATTNTIEQPNVLQIFRLDPDEGWVEFDIIDRLGEGRLEGIAALDEGAVFTMIGSEGTRTLVWTI